MKFLRSLPAEMAGRVATHRDAGEITLAQMLHEWALHDLGHIRQAAEFVRARKHLEGAGPLGRSSRYSLMCAYGDTDEDRELVSYNLMRRVAPPVTTNHHLVAT